MYILLRKEDLPDLQYVKGSYATEAYCKYNEHLIYIEGVEINKGEFIAFKPKHDPGPDICRFCTRLGLPDYRQEGTYTRHLLSQLPKIVC